MGAVLDSLRDLDQWACPTPNLGRELGGYRDPRTLESNQMKSGTL